MNPLTPMTVKPPNLQICGQRFHKENFLKALNYAHIRPFQKCKVCKCEIINNHTMELNTFTKYAWSSKKFTNVTHVKKYL